MSRVVFIASTGRCSTQFLAEALRAADPAAVVEHEAIGPFYMPRRVFRRPQRFARVIGHSPALQAKLDQIGALLAEGRTYVETGWPSFAWMPYLARRFGAAFSFVHLVRSPFPTAASHLTHGQFTGAWDAFARHALIYSTDEAVAYPQFREGYGHFSPFEKCLIQWLEVNAFLRDQHRLRSFAGLVRFEDLHGPDPAVLQGLAETVLGHALPPVPSRPLDRRQEPLTEPLTLTHLDLAEAVVALAEALGYSEAEIEATSDLEALSARYRARRATAPRRGVPKHLAVARGRG